MGVYVCLAIMVAISPFVIPAIQMMNYVRETNIDIRNMLMIYNNIKITEVNGTVDCKTYMANFEKGNYPEYFRSPNSSGIDVCPLPHYVVLESGWNIKDSVVIYPKNKENYKAKRYPLILSDGRVEYRRD